MFSRRLLRTVLEKTVIVSPFNLDHYISIGFCKFDAFNLDYAKLLTSGKDCKSPFPQRTGQTVNDLTLSQTSPGFYVSEVQVFRKHCGKRRNCSSRAISPFPIVFSTRLENFVPFSWNF